MNKLALLLHYASKQCTQNGKCVDPYQAKSSLILVCSSFLPCKSKTFGTLVDNTDTLHQFGSY